MQDNRFLVRDWEEALEDGHGFTLHQIDTVIGEYLIFDFFFNPTQVRQEMGGGKGGGKMLFCHTLT